MGIETDKDYFLGKGVLFEKLFYLPQGDVRSFFSREPISPCAD
jgi:hypothetical protein